MTTSLVPGDQTPIGLAARKAPALKVRGWGLKGWKVGNNITERYVRTWIAQNEGLYRVRDNWKESGHDQIEAQHSNDHRAGWADGIQRR